MTISLDCDAAIKWGLVSDDDDKGKIDDDGEGTVTDDNANADVDAVAGDGMCVLPTAADISSIRISMQGEENR